MSDVRESSSIQTSHRVQDRGLAIVTGGSRGIGKAAALALAKSGFDIAVLDIVGEQEANKSLQQIQSIRPASSYVFCDISAIQDHEPVLDGLRERYGDFSCLVNNAGIQMVPRRDMLELTPEEYDRIINTNLRGTFFLTQAFAHHICRSSSPCRTIINVTSVNAAMVSIEKSSYCISKAGLSMASQLYAMKLAEYGVHVYEVRPGYTKTAMTAPIYESVTTLIEEGLVPAKRWGEADEVGRTIASLASGCLCYTTGDIIYVAGGMQIPRIK